MKEFDLQAALDGAKVVTRDGRSVRIEGYNAKQFEPLIGWIDGMAAGWNMYGQYNNPEENDADLFMAVTESKQWVVIAKNKEGALVSYGPYVAKCHAESVAIVECGTIHEITILE